MWRSMPVCSRCWAERYPSREAISLKTNPEVDCTVCEEPTTSGIYVRMEVRWPR